MLPKMLNAEHFNESFIKEVNIELTLVLHRELESGNRTCNFKMSSLISSSVNLDLLLDMMILSYKQAHQTLNMCKTWIKPRWGEQWDT